MAAGGARAAARADAAHRRAHATSAADDPECTGPRCGVPAGAAANWAGPIGRNVRIDTLGRGRCRRSSADTRRNWSRSRRTSSWPLATRPWGRCNRRPAPCRSCSRWSPIRSAPVSSQSLARPGGNATGFTQFRIRHQRKMAGTAQADRARRDASGGPSRSHRASADRPVRRNPGRGAVARGGVQPGRRARCRRDRARDRRHSRARRMAA